MSENLLKNLGSFQDTFSEMSIGSDLDYGRHQQAFIQTVQFEQRLLFDKRFAVYRNNVHHSLIQALVDTFPVVEQLVGEDFFTMMAKEYLHLSPPKSAVLLEFGDQFPEFIRSFRPAESLGYLSDVAKLEYAWQQSYHAKDQQSLSGEYFSEIAAEDLYERKLNCHPSLQMVSADYAVGSIWQAHQSDSSEEVNIDSPEWLTLVRPEYEVQVCFLDEPGFRFIERLTQQEKLGDAINELSIAFPDWDIGQAFAFAIQSGFFVSTNN